MTSNTASLRSNTGRQIVCVFNENTRLFDTNITCISCDKVTALSLQPKGVEHYQLGALVQDAFPALTEGERELFISGICNDCFDAMFKE